MAAASNYLNARLVGRTLEESRSAILAEIAQRKDEIDELTAKLIAAGLASWSGSPSENALIVKGQSKMLETKEAMVRLLDATRAGEGVQIFIGASTPLFGVTGCSMIVAPYTNSREQVVGAIGVIGPTRLNYARIIPMVDYTAKVIGRLMG